VIASDALANEPAGELVALIRSLVLSTVSRIGDFV